MQEARELANDPSNEYSAAPLEVCTPPRDLPYVAYAYSHPIAP